MTQERIPLQDQVCLVAKQMLRRGVAVYTNTPEGVKSARDAGLPLLQEALADYFQMTPMRIRQLLFSSGFKVRDADIWATRNRLKLLHPSVIYRAPPQSDRRAIRRVLNHIARRAFGLYRF